MLTHVSKKLNLNISSHSEIEFVDTVLSKDTTVFIDPCLIEINQAPWCVRANRIICSFFDKFYQLYRSEIDNQDELLKFFSHAHEINATKLGYGETGNNGKAKTAEGMVETFSEVSNLLKGNIELEKSYDLPVFIDGFAEDCLSDLLTNILFKELVEFTVNQCKKYGIEVSEKTNKNHYYWDEQKNDWSRYEGPCWYVDNQLILLVPKNIVRHRYYTTVNQYFGRVILTRVKRETASIDSAGKQQHESKKALKEKMVQGKTIRECVIQYTRAEPQVLEEYHRLIPGLYFGQSMTDEQLDDIVYS